ncbi:MAG: hypothetical protein EBY16_06980 [Gammaproteobacteria bacterium]|nr:hypothetical protein [Gammaproteobacteria bacterium]
MPKFLIIPVLILMMGLSGCAPINTEFSCNATAGDKCLSIEEVYALSERAKSNPKRPMVFCRTCVAPRRIHRTTQPIWVPPMVDSAGVEHPANVVIADVQTNEIIT